MTVEAIAAPTTPQRQTHRGFVVAALILAMFTAAIEGTIVATAMPTIAGKLGSFELFSWVFSIFLLTQAASIPIYGRLADMYGRKPIFIGGCSIFILGTVLCATAQSMPMLIAFRAVQGIGAGSIIPISATLIGDLFTIKERARVQGWMSSVWGISSVAGPTTGGFIVDTIGWRWIFLLNVPLALLSMSVLIFFLHERLEKRQHKIDYAGSLLMVAATSTFLVFLLEGGKSWPWFSGASMGLLATALVTLAAFLYHENRTPEPLLPLSLFRSRLIAVASLITLATGVITIGISGNVPNFVQGVHGESATVAGLALAGMTMGWPIASVTAGHVLVSKGFRFSVFLGAPPLLISGIWLSTFNTHTTPLEVAGATFVLGLAMGFISTSIIVMVQNAVDWTRRGVVTSTNMFMRQMGSALGIAVLGALVNSQVHGLKVPGPNGSLVSTDALLDENRRRALSPETIAQLSSGLTDGLHLAFLAILAMSLLAIAVIALLPKTPVPHDRRPDAQSPDAASPEPVESVSG
ncbi:MAG TPA: MDR family MFS transporter [Dehalococcoidia bacterium]|nr:MDR family MFS transporter [Dehalococcoidia bacterium]